MSIIVQKANEHNYGVRLLRSLQLAKLFTKNTKCVVTLIMRNENGKNIKFSSRPCIVTFKSNKHSGNFVNMVKSKIF